jgi:hypothetical protein
VDELAKADGDGGLVGQMLGLHLASQAGTDANRSQNRQRDQRSDQDREQLRADRQVPDHLLSTASRVGTFSVVEYLADRSSERGIVERRPDSTPAGLRAYKSSRQSRNISKSQ